MITIQIGAPRSYIKEQLPPAFSEAINRALMFTTNELQWAAAQKAGDWDGYMREYNPQARSFPTGMLDRVTHVLEKCGLEWTTQGWYDVEVHQFPQMAELLRDYQRDAVDTLIHTRWGQLESPPRTGKTVIGAADIQAHGLHPTSVIVPATVTIAPAYQFHAELTKWLGEPIGFVGDGQCEIQRISVFTSASAYEALVRSKVIKPISEKRKKGQYLEQPLPRHMDAANHLIESRMLLIDEAHMIDSRRDRAVLRAMKRTLVRHGLTGTPWKQDGTGYVTEAVVGPVIHRIRRGPLVDAGWLVPMAVTMQRVPAKRYTKSDHYSTVYKDYIVNNDWRNQCIVDWVRARVDEGKTGVIIVSRKTHGKVLAGMLPDATEIYGAGTGAKIGGETKGKKRTDLLDRARAGEIPVAISTVMDMAVDVPRWSWVVISCGGLDSALAQQRADRASTAWEDKTECEVLDFLDQARSLRGQAQERIKHYLGMDRCDVTVVGEDGEVAGRTGGTESELI